SIKSPTVICEIGNPEQWDFAAKITRRIWVSWQNPVKKSGNRYLLSSSATTFAVTTFTAASARLIGGSVGN
ncbi:hypothetical protein U1Q18_023402, partial [Sarracenia purpurea var. burkii]